MILWICEKPLSQNMRAMVGHQLANAGCKDYRLQMFPLRNFAPDIVTKSFKKSDFVSDIARARARTIVCGQASQYHVDLIVCEDVMAVRALTGEDLSLDQANGSLFWVKGVSEGKQVSFPMLCVLSARVMNLKGDQGYITKKVYEKIARWANGTQKRVPAFDYVLCDTLDKARSAVEAACLSPYMAKDIETTGTKISCDGFTWLTPSGGLQTAVIPIDDPRKDWQGYRFWAPDAEKEIHGLLKKLNASPALKIMQNGWYDSSYYILNGLTPFNYLADTALMQHSLCPESPKHLNDLSAMYLDYYQFWKSDIKGDKMSLTKGSDEQLLLFWNYNGLDNYNTILNFFALLEEFKKHPYAYTNYSKSLRLMLGPCAEVNIGGLRVFYPTWKKRMDAFHEETDVALASLKHMVGDEFNPRSPAQRGYFLFDFLHAQPTRLQKRFPKKYGKTSTDKKVLKLVQEQANPFCNNYIKRLEAFAKPDKKLSTFGSWHKLTFRNSGRFMEWLNVMGTETFRMSSGHSSFWCGGNGQNITGKMKEVFVADEDWVYVDADYSASDDRFIAHESRDPVKIDVVESGKDPHCFHAAMFFQEPYEKLVEAHSREDPWTDDPETGIRQLAKKVGHGKNYGAGADTIFDNMGRTPVVHAAIQLGHPDADAWDTKRLVAICQYLCDRYDSPRIGIYKRLGPWRKELVSQVINNGGLYTNVFGYTRYFPSNLNDPATHREIVANCGQGDTAGNCNKAMDQIFYKVCDDKCHIRKQVHDSLGFLIHKSVLNEKIAAIKSIMEQPTTIRDDTFVVPVDVQCGLIMSKHMVGWHPGLTYEELVEFTRKQFGFVPFENDGDAFFPGKGTVSPALAEQLAGRSTPESGSVPQDASRAHSKRDDVHHGETPRPERIDDLGGDIEGMARDVEKSLEGLDLSDLDLDLGYEAILDDPDVSEDDPDLIDADLIP